MIISYLESSLCHGTNIVATMSNSLISLCESHFLAYLRIYLYAHSVVRLCTVLDGKGEKIKSILFSFDK